MENLAPDVRAVLKEHKFLIFVNSTEEGITFNSPPTFHVPAVKRLYRFAENSVEFSGGRGEKKTYEAPAYAHRLFVIQDIEAIITTLGFPEALFCLTTGAGEVGTLKEVIPAPEGDDLVKEEYLENIYVTAMEEGFPESYLGKAEEQGVLDGYVLLTSEE